VTATSASSGPSKDAVAELGERGCELHGCPVLTPNLVLLSAPTVVGLLCSDCVMEQWDNFESVLMKSKPSAKVGETAFGL